MKQLVFTIGEEPQAYIGYTSGRLWNGWATPYFEKEEATRVMRDFNKDAETLMCYDEEADTFRIAETECTDEEVWVGKDYQTDDGIKHLYGIGAYSWVWEFVDDRDCLYLAQVIEDFIYEFDTYGYRDVGIDRAEMVEQIKTQLKELTVYKQAYELWHKELDDDAKFEELSKLLTV